MFKRVYKRIFGRDRKASGPPMCDPNGDTLSICRQRTKLYIRLEEEEIQQKRLAAAVARRKSAEDRDVEMEIRWLTKKLNNSEEENICLIERLRKLRESNYKLGQQLRNSQDHIKRQEADHAARLRVLKEKCRILSSMTTKMLELI